MTEVAASAAAKAVVQMATPPPVAAEVLVASPSPAPALETVEEVVAIPPHAMTESEAMATVIEQTYVEPKLAPARGMGLSTPHSSHAADAAPPPHAADSTASKAVT